MREKEACLHAFGLLADQLALSKDYRNTAIQLLQQFVYPELNSGIGFLKARACWVYAQFAKFEMNEEHLKYAMDAIFKNLTDQDLPVRVNAAIALVRLLENHSFGADLIRPGLS